MTEAISDRAGSTPPPPSFFVRQPQSVLELTCVSESRLARLMQNVMPRCTLKLVQKERLWKVLELSLDVSL